MDSSAKALPSAIGVPAVVPWAIAGAAFLALQVYVYVAWMMSGDFHPTLPGPDPVPSHMPPLQPAADEFAAEAIMGNAEEVHKILNGLAREHESTVLYATWGLVKNMLEAVAVQKGLMIVSENRYFDLIQDAMSYDSKWTDAFRTAWGLDSASSQYQSRGAAALKLYKLSAAMFDELIPTKHRDVVNNTLQLIKEAGYS